jgi:DNA (cytosine-5)-methyltransferase 1
MAILQGFPSDFEFTDASLANMYRHIGDAVPPLISYQLAYVCEWILNGKKPHSSSLILKNTHLHKSDIERSVGQQLLTFAAG